MSILGEDKIKHMHAVAEFMYRKAPSYGLDPDEMYIIGLLHDIGYVHGPSGHPMHGARMLGKITESFNEACNLIAAHGMSPSEYRERTGEKTIPRALILLWEADMRIGCAGETMTYAERITDIERRYGSGSDQYRNAKQITDYLIGTVRTDFEEVEDGNYSENTDGHGTRSNAG